MNHKLKSNKLDLAEINQRITDRSNIFYWQTDRAITSEEARLIWQDRHSYFSDDEIVASVNHILKDDKLIKLKPFDLKSQMNLGNVNSVRKGELSSGKKMIIRLHPKGVANGYFYVESLVAELARENGLPSYQTFAIHDLENLDDFSFQVIESLPGVAVQRWLESHSQDEAKLLYQIGQNMAKIHQIRVSGFGPFNNTQAKLNNLVGLHDNLMDSVRAGLNFNLKILTQEGLINDTQVKEIKNLFSSSNLLLKLDQAVLVHNDFADWNLLTDGQVITGILDWDEAVAGDPIMDIACWSTFFDPDRIEGFLAGYWSVASKPDDFQERFEFFRLRYVISKMTLRLRRLAWDDSKALKERIEAGSRHLKESLAYFKI